MILGLSVERAALLGVTLLGMALCTRGIGAVAAKGDWASWHAIAGYGLGAAALAIGLGAGLGLRLPFLADERAALFALLGIIVLKYGLGLAR
ncbi:MAG: hypothetical protein ACYC4L_21060 [Chloroflexota bacterium]